VRYASGMVGAAVSQRPYGARGFRGHRTRLADGSAQASVRRNGSVCPTGGIMLLRVGSSRRDAPDRRVSYAPLARLASAVIVSPVSLGPVHVPQSHSFT
jgi:hypothetical protein